jgi:hypothetical protein
MQSVMMIVIVAMLLGAHQTVNSQTKRCQEPAARRGTIDLKARPRLGVEYSSMATFKIASRKTTYHIGEMISVDLAILSTARAPVFLHKLLVPSITLNARNDRGGEASIRAYTTILESIVPQSYELLQPSEIILGSFQLLAGCNVEGLSAFAQVRNKLNEEIHQNRANYQKGLFERDLFVNWGEACLALQQPGSFTVTVEQTNDHVIESPCEPGIRTAVGTIRSNPLTITIIE